MNFEKANNQYYAMYIESKVVSLINKTPHLVEINFSFSDEDIQEMNNDAQKIVDFLQGEKAVWVGRQCGNEKCDIIIDGERQVELKYVSCGNGTYLNSSLEYFSSKLGFTPFTEYTHKYICPILEPIYGDKVYKNFSPVTMQESKDIRHGQKELYALVQNADKEMRKKYVEDLYNFLIQNPDKCIIFISDMINKNVNNKYTPDELVIFNHITKEIKTFSKEEIKKLIKNKNIKKNALGLVFDGFRVQIGWQNGNGLNNPTLRVFLK